MKIFKNILLLLTIILVNLNLSVRADEGCDRLKIELRRADNIIRDYEGMISREKNYNRKAELGRTKAIFEEARKAVLNERKNFKC